MECDTFGHGIGSILFKEGRPIAFKIFQLKENNLPKPIYEKDILVILHAIKK